MINGQLRHASDVETVPAYRAVKIWSADVAVPAWLVGAMCLTAAVRALLTTENADTVNVGSVALLACPQDEATQTQQTLDERNLDTIAVVEALRAQGSGYWASGLTKALTGRL